MNPSGRLSSFLALLLVPALWTLPGSGAELTLESYAGKTVEQVAIDGPRISARFGAPTGVAMDAQGNVWIADRGAAVIRRISPTGEVKTVAGLAGQREHRDGTGGSARFPETIAIAVDAAGNAWVSDYDSIRRVSPSGRVVTVAGGFFDPRGLAVDTSGNVWVADSGNQTIRRVSPEGVVTTIAGLHGQGGRVDGQGASARFLYPTGIALDRDGNAWVTDTTYIRRITPSGFVTTLALTGFTAAFNRFDHAYGIVVDADGSLVVADYLRHVIVRVATSGQVSLLAGSTGVPSARDGSASSARFRHPVGVSRGPAGSVLVADSENGAIRRISGADGTVTTYAGGPVPPASTTAVVAFDGPEGIAADTHGNIWVADRNHAQIRRVATDGVITTVFGANSPTGIAIDTADNVWVVSQGSHVVRRRSPTGLVTIVAGLENNAGAADGTGAAARFFYPHSIAVDATGNAWVADTRNGTIRRVTPDGVVTTVAGIAGTFELVDGDGPAARFLDPRGISIDETGLIWVADAWTVRTMTPAGHVVTVVGSPSVQGDDLFTAIAARGGGAWVLAQDSEPQYRSKPVFHVTAAGAVEIVAANGSALHASGTGQAAGLFFPNAITVDAAGTVFVADHTGLFRSVPTIPDRASVDRTIGLVGQPFVLKVANPTAPTLLWSMSRKPGESEAEPLAPSSPSTSVVPDVADHYEVRLTASSPAGKSVSAVSFQAVSRGDLNADAELDVFDLVNLASYLAGNLVPGVAPFVSPREAADVNGDSAYDVLDLVLLQAVLVGNAIAP